MLGTNSYAKLTSILLPDRIASMFELSDDDTTPVYHVDDADDDDDDDDYQSTTVVQCRPVFDMALVGVVVSVAFGKTIYQVRFC